MPGIKLFSGRYSAVPIVVHEDGKEIIILEIKSGSRYFYYKCCSPEDYLDLQKVLLGKADITAHTKMSIVNTNERLARQIPKMGGIHTDIRIVWGNVVLLEVGD